MTTEFRTVAMFVITDFQKLRACGVCMFMNNTRIKFQD
jgi:hypothetical protein